jgi:hypothetical protein
MNSELALMNEENCTEFDMMNEENNAILITSSNLTDEVKNIFEDLVIENFRHQDYQSICFERLLKVWLGENFLAASSPSLDIKKETERFDNDVKRYVIKTIAKYLPDGENKIYSEYYSLLKNENITVYSEGESTIYRKDQIDVKLFTGYIQQLNKKIMRQYDNLKHNFGVYLKGKMDDAAEFFKLNNDPVLFELRRSGRNLNKIPIDFKPMLSFNNTKKKRTITYFLKTNTTSNTTSKKRKV